MSTPLVTDDLASEPADDVPALAEAARRADGVRPVDLARGPKKVILHAKPGTGPSAVDSASCA
jgi:hypothetical protein